jgi:hypothetical protein
VRRKSEASTVSFRNGAGRLSVSVLSSHGVMVDQMDFTLVLIQICTILPDAYLHGLETEDPQSCIDAMIP